MHNLLKVSRKSRLLWVLVLMLLCVCISAFAASGTGATTASGVYLRKEASKSSDYWFRLPLGFTATYSDTVTDASGVTWYRLTVSDPSGNDPNVRTGYVHGDYFASTTVTSTTSGNTSVAGSNATGVISNGGVNMRTGPGMNYDTVFKDLNAGTVVELLSIPSDTDPDPWYQVRYDGRTGYIRGMFIRVLSYGTTATSTTNATATLPATVTATVAGPGSVSQATAVPTSAPTAVPQTSTNTVTLIKSSAHLRLTPNGSIWEDWEQQGATLPMNGSPVTQDGYTWYPVLYKGRMLYVRGDCVQAVYNGQSVATAAPTQATVLGYVRTTVSGVNLRLQPSGESITTIAKNQILPYIATPTVSGKYTWYYVEYQNLHGYVRSDCVELYGTSATAVPTVTTAPASGSYGYIRVTKSGVNVRTSPSGSRVTTVNINTVWPMTGNAVTESKYTWYPVSVNGISGYIRGDCAYKMTDSQVAEYLSQTSVATPAPTESTQTTTYLGYIQTTKSTVNVRAKPSGTVIGRVDKGVTLGYTTKTTSGGYTWYLCNTSVGLGYLRSDCVKEVQADGSQVVVTAMPTAQTNTGSTTRASTGQVEASYSSLKEGSSGAAVTNLVTELKNQGYYTGEITSSYTSAVTAAVKAFQSARGLTADGVAGVTTQHAIFGTTEIGGTNTNDRNMTIFPAEKIDWYTGGIQELLPRGSNFKVYDVKTGYVWWAHRWAGGKHADIEPLTAADTAILCKIYGVNSASEITSKSHWQRRPCLVTVGTRTFACSLYGVPHNPDGDTIADNEMTGQICLHFTNSRTHDSDKVDSYHTEAIQYAWEHAPNGNK